MTTMTTRKKSNYSNSTRTDDDTCSNYTELMTEQDVPVDHDMTSECSSGSSITELNNNTNGKVMTTIEPHVDINGNRQQLAEAPKVPSPTLHDPDPTFTVVKKIKQIYMEEAPMHLSGLSISGSGMELFVKLDEKLDKALRQANRTESAKRGKRKRVIMKRKRLDKFLPLNTSIVTNPPSEKEPQCNTTGTQSGSSRREDNIDADGGHHLTGPKQRTTQNNEVMTELSIQDGVEATPTPSKSSVADHLRRLNIAPSQVYSPQGWIYNFQTAQPTPATGFRTNMIQGPTWNVENGQIDVFKTQDPIPRAHSNDQVRTTSKDNDDLDIPIDYNRNPFPGGFESQNLPLKRRMSPPRWPPYRTKQVLKQYDQYGNDNTCANNEYVRKEKYRQTKKEKIRKKSKQKNTPFAGIPSTSEKEALAAVENGFSLNRDVKATSSDMSNAQQSSIGPQFQTELITPQTMDAEALIKFTQYTQEMRRDLKKKYKDLSKLLKAFGETVQMKNEMEEEVEKEPEVGRCIVM